MRWRGPFGLLLATSLCVVSCRSGEISNRTRASEGLPGGAPRQTSSPSATPKTAPAKPSPQLARQPSKPSHAPDWGWGDAIQWHDFEDAQQLAASEGRPIFLLVYAKWCSKCRALAPIFARPEIVELSQHFVMARQDHDEQPDWLERVVPGTGNYVPRIYFLDPDGSLRRDITSGNPRFPYFSPPRQPRVLLASLNRALGRD